jgi:hypothetical protein
MTVWWIGNIAYLAVVVPIVVVLLTLLLRAALEVSRHARDIAEAGRALPPGVGGLHADLGQTVEQAKQVANELERYGRALDRLV